MATKITQPSSGKSEPHFNFISFFSPDKLEFLNAFSAKLGKHSSAPDWVGPTTSDYLLRCSTIELKETCGIWAIELAPCDD